MSSASVAATNDEDAAAGGTQIVGTAAVGDTLVGVAAAAAAPPLPLSQHRRRRNRARLSDATANGTATSSSIGVSNSTRRPLRHPRPTYACSPCLDVPSRRIRAIVHGTTSDGFWVKARAAAVQAARDAGGVDLEFELYEEFDAETMARDVEAVAIAAERANSAAAAAAALRGDGGSDGGNAAANESPRPGVPEALVVTVPSPAVRRAAERATAAGVPVFGFNSGYEYTAGVDGMVSRGTMVGFWSMDEYRGGAEAATALWNEWAAAADASEGAETGAAMGGSIASGGGGGGGGTNSTINGTRPLRAIERALFVNSELENAALAERRDGFNATLRSLVEDARAAGTLPPDYPGLIVDQVVAAAIDDEGAFGIIQKALGKECRYQAVMLTGGRLVEPALAAINLHGCHASSVPPPRDDSTRRGLGARRNQSLRSPPDDTTPVRGRRTLLGTFDTSSAIFSHLHLRRLSLAVSQQQHLQASLPVLSAALYATTGYALVSPPLDSGGGGGVYLTGPRLYTPEDALSDTEQACNNDGWPVCSATANATAALPQPSEGSARQRECPCTDRSAIRLGGVVHGIATDPFWDPFFAASERAASEFGVDLDLTRFEPQEDEETLHLKMSYRILSLCQSGNVDGIFVSIPSEVVEDAVRACAELDVPIVSVNAGANASRRLGLLHHLGMNEYDAGKFAGAELVKSGNNIRVAYCVNHAPGVSVTAERCAGFEKAVAEAGVDFGGVIDVPQDTAVLYGKRVEDAVGDAGGGDDWDGVGLLLCGVDSQLGPALEVKAAHPKLKIGAMDVSTDMSTALDDGLILFGVDQQEFVQGYFPVALLTYIASTGEVLLNRAVETGPRLVTASTSIAEQTCEASFFEACPQVTDEDFTYISSGYRVTGIVLFSVQAFFSVAFIAWTIVNRKKMIVSVSQPEFLVLIAFGSLVLGSSILPTLVQGQYRYVQDPVTGQLTNIPDDDVRRADAACMAFPWLAGLGFVFVFSALFAKILRVKKVYDGAVRFSRAKVEVKDTAIVVVMMTLAEVTILLTWQFVSPLRWEREVLQVDENGYPTKSVGMCTSDNYLAFIVPFLGFKAVCLFYGLVLCYRTRNVPSSLSEGKWISFSVLSMFQITLLAVPALVIVDENTDAFFFVRAAVVFLISFSVTALIFFPKAYDLVNPLVEYGESLRFSRGRPSVNVRTVQAQIGRGNFFTDTSCASCTRSCATHDMTLVCAGCKRNAMIMMADRKSSTSTRMLLTETTSRLSAPSTRLVGSIVEEEENNSVREVQDADNCEDALDCSCPLVEQKFDDEGDYEDIETSNTMTEGGKIQKHAVLNAEKDLIDCPSEGTAAGRKALALADQPHQQPEPDSTLARSA